MKQITISILLCLCLISKAMGDDLPRPFCIIPFPQELRLDKGEAVPYSSISFIYSDNDYPVLPSLLDGLPRQPKAGLGVYLSLSTSDIIPQNDEAYYLSIAADSIIVKARTQTGLFYACQTLQQLMEDSRDFKQPIPALTIIDYPAIAYRAVHLDTKHHLDRMEYYYRMVDKLAYYKVNAIIWELEDKLRYFSHPEIGSNNAISIQEMQAFCRYSEERHVNVSPLVQGLGHAPYILKHHPELRENPNSDWEFCPSNEATYTFLFDLYREALEAMPYAKYLHVGGDEITKIGIDERCKATGKSAFELQMYWLTRVATFAEKHNVAPIFWDDMPLKHGNLWHLINSSIQEPELSSKWNTERLDSALTLFPRNCIYMRWNYEDPTMPAHQKLIEWYGNNNLKVMGATAAAYGNSPFLPRNNSLASNIKSFCSLVAQHGLIGILATSWDDGSPHLETVQRGYAATGAFAWRPNTDITAFIAAHGQREFGFNADNNQMLFLKELEESFSFFDNALVQSGRRNPAWGVVNHKLIDLPDKADKKHSWSIKYANKLQQAHKEATRYEKLKTDLKQLQASALRNRYTLAIYEQLNELQNYPVRLLLALEAYDNADKKHKPQALNDIRNILNSFNDLRQTYEYVYSSTRFLNQPHGFIPDQNHHNHMAALSTNTDWMYLYELDFNKALTDWLN